MSLINIDIDEINKRLKDYRGVVLNSIKYGELEKHVERATMKMYVGDILNRYIDVVMHILLEKIDFIGHENIPTINPAKDETSIDYSIKSDKGKYKPTLCHQITIEAVSRVREHGASRYGGTETWKRVEEQRYKDALYRHWLAYLENPDGIDSDSGLLHLYHVACNLDFLLEIQRERINRVESNIHLDNSDLT